MKIAFACPGCGKTFHKTNSLGGHRALCRACRREFVIPTPTGPDHPFPPDVLHFTCPDCGEVYHKDNTLAGQRARCVACQLVFTVPDHEDDVPYVAPAPVPAPAFRPPPAPASCNNSTVPKPPATPAPTDESEADQLVDFEFLPEDDDDGPDHDRTVPMPLAAFRSTAGPLEPDDPDDEPIVFEIIETDDATEPEPLLDSAELVPVGKTPKAKATRAAVAVGMERLARRLDRISAMPWLLKRLIIVMIALVAVLVFTPAGQGVRDTLAGWYAVVTGTALDPDDEPDPELDDNPPAVVRPALLAQHEQALDGMAAAFDAMSAVLDTITDGPSAATASPRLDAASAQLEQASSAGAKLARANRAELARLRDGASTRARVAVHRLVDTLTRKAQIPGLGSPLDRMRTAFAQTRRQLDAEYRENEIPRVEIKVTGVSGNGVSDVVTARFDADIPKPYRRFVGVGIDGNTHVMRIKLGPVEDPKEIVDHIRFGKVEKVVGRRVRVALRPPDEAELAAARAAKAARDRTANPPPPQAPARAPTVPATWFVLFRGRDPKAWNTDARDGPTQAALLAAAPAGIQYLRLTRLDTGEALIVAVTNADLSRRISAGEDPTRPFRWCGTNDDAWGARHLGIAEGPLIKGGDPKAHGPVMVQAEGADQFLGSGFGHEGYGDGTSQHFGWRGRKIDPTDFEIAVGPGPLSAAEETLLLVGHH